MGLGDYPGASFGAPGVSFGALGGFFWSLCSEEPLFSKNELPAEAGTRFWEPVVARHGKRDYEKSRPYD